MNDEAHAGGLCEFQSRDFSRNFIVGQIFDFLRPAHAGGPGEFQRFDLGRIIVFFKSSTFSDQPTQVGFVNSKAATLVAIFWLFI